MTAPLRNPAVALNPGTAGVGIIHALSLGDVDIVTVGRRWPPLLGRFSRFPRQRFTCESAGETLAHCLLRVADRFEGKGVLFPPSTSTSKPFLLEQEHLSQRYHVPAAPHIGARIFAKNWQYEIAARAGVPVPRHTRFHAGERPDCTSSASRSSSSRPRARRRWAGAPSVSRPWPISRRSTGCSPSWSGIPRPRVPARRKHPRRADAALHGRIVQRPRGTRRALVHRRQDLPASVQSRRRQRRREPRGLEERVVRQAVALLETARFHGISQVEFKYDRATTRTSCSRSTAARGRGLSSPPSPA